MGKTTKCEVSAYSHDRDVKTLADEMFDKRQEKVRAGGGTEEHRTYFRDAQELGMSYSDFVHRNKVELQIAVDWEEVELTPQLYAWLTKHNCRKTVSKLPHPSTHGL